jgi:chemotaxis regulatin CheY-phosphate phosphatase CheZ
MATSLTTFSTAEYAAIEAAVMETARGRWFLGEFARRNRTADTNLLLEAIGRLEQAIATERSAQDLDRLRFDLMEMAKAISLTKTEIAAIRPVEHQQSHLVVASETLDAITRTTERATSDILEAAEQIQETAWTLREQGVNPTLCHELDRRATEIYTACSFQDLTAQQMGKIVQTLRYLEGRIDAMIEIWGGAAAGLADEAPKDAGAAPRPSLDGERPDLSQTDVDIVIVNDDLFAGPGTHDARFAVSAPAANAPPSQIDDLAFLEAPREPPAAEPPPESAAEQRPLRLEAFAEIEALDMLERLKRFT